MLRKGSFYIYPSLCNSITITLKQAHLCQSISSPPTTILQATHHRAGPTSIFRLFLKRSRPIHPYNGVAARWPNSHVEHLIEFLSYLRLCNPTALLSANNYWLFFSFLFLYLVLRPNKHAADITKLFTTSASGSKSVIRVNRDAACSAANVIMAWIAKAHFEHRAADSDANGSF